MCGCFIQSGWEGFTEQVGDTEQDRGELKEPAMGPSGRIPLQPARAVCAKVCLRNSQGPVGLSRGREGEDREVAGAREGRTS